MQYQAPNIQRWPHLPGRKTSIS